ncbi:DinB family protein [Flaviaesturariibacter amylovorans]|uniref:DinB-like domain-containing protein n=1 Tax=Flaviaesturariibacter amylovorans TaxID=1084520 RepID=A0ABP8HUW3_9BACT
MMDLDAYYERLDRQEAEMVELARSIPEHRAPEGAEGRWSPVQELEHVCLLEGLVWHLLQRGTETRAGVPELFGDAKLEKLLVQGRQYKIVAPEIVQPKGSLTTVDAFIDRFQQQRTQLKEDLSSGRIRPDDRTYRHPILGELTMIDWLHFMVQHTQRHLLALRESLHLSTPIA